MVCLCAFKNHRHFRFRFPSAILSSHINTHLPAVSFCVRPALMSKAADFKQSAGRRIVFQNMRADTVQVKFPKSPGNQRLYRIPSIASAPEHSQNLDLDLCRFVTGIYIREHDNSQPLLRFFPSRNDPAQTVGRHRQKAGTVRRMHTG